MSNAKVNAASPVAVDAALQQELREFDWSGLPTPVPTKNERELRQMRQHKAILERLVEVQGDIIKGQEQVINCQNDELFDEVRQLNFKVVMQFWMIASVVILLTFLRFV